MVWHSALRLNFTHHSTDSYTRLSDRTHQGVLRVQRALYPEPAPQQGICHTLLIYPPSGIAGGDNLAMDIQLQPHSHVVITTPGANKWYGMPLLKLNSLDRLDSHEHQKNQIQQDKQILLNSPSFSTAGYQHTHLTLAAQARLEWLPQETLFYNHTHANAINHIYLDETASFIGWEINVLGRQAYQENLTQGQLNLRTIFWRKNTKANDSQSADYTPYVPIFSDILSQKFFENNPSVPANTDWKHALIGNQNKPIFATLWAVPVVKAGGNLPTWVTTLRELITAHALDVEVTATDKVLLVRYLGHEVQACFSAFSQIRGELRRLMWGLENHEPRIWAT